jgi:CheY-like chemotaxis protein
VLVVDDDPAFLGLVARILSDLGVESVRTAADASQALIVAEDARPAAVLVDIGLPDRDGTDLAYELSDLPWRPRVVLTSSDSEAFLAIEPRDGHRELAFIPKEDLAGGTLRRALLDG